MLSTIFSNLGAHNNYYVLLITVQFGYFVIHSFVGYISNKRPKTCEIIFY